MCYWIAGWHKIVINIYSSSVHRASCPQNIDLEIRNGATVLFCAEQCAILLILLWTIQCHEYLSPLRDVYINPIYRGMVNCYCCIHWFGCGYLTVVATWQGCDESCPSSGRTGWSYPALSNKYIYMHTAMVVCCWKNSLKINCLIKFELQNYFIIFSIIWYFWLFPCQCGLVPAVGVMLMEEGTASLFCDSDSDIQHR